MRVRFGFQMYPKGVYMLKAWSPVKLRGRALIRVQIVRSLITVGHSIMTSKFIVISDVMEKK